MASYTPLIVILGVLPSFVWLYFFLKEDCEPEPRSLLAKVFLMGIIISPLAIIFQLGFACVLQLSQGGGSCFTRSIISDTITNGPLFFLWAAFIEEIIKFLAVKFIILDSPEFNEPTDGMIYMITAALGFATMENILVLFNTSASHGMSLALNTLALRFFGATLLHALSSGVLGYFLAVAWFFDKHRKKFIVLGIGAATILHFIFNFMLASFNNQKVGLIMSSALLLGLALLIYGLFLHARKRYCAATGFK